jgi:hypothetical protein
MATSISPSRTEFLFVSVARLAIPPLYPKRHWFTLIVIVVGSANVRFCQQSWLVSLSSVL